MKYVLILRIPVGFIFIYFLSFTNLALYMEDDHGILVHCVAFQPVSVI